MKQEFAKLAIGSQLTLHMNHEEKQIEIVTSIVKHLKHNIALIAPNEHQSEIPKLNNKSITVIYTNDIGTQYVWSDAIIVCYQGHYLLQVHTDGVKQENRRGSFRVEFSQTAKLSVVENGVYDVVVKDISLTGFAIIDELGILNLEPGTSARLEYEDIGHVLKLEGNVVRTQLIEHKTLYGFVITRACKDLQSYVQTKQRIQRRNHS